MKYLIKMKDGSVGIMAMILDCTVEECIAKWHESVKCNVIRCREIKDELIPISREFRDAWCDETDNEFVDIDLSKAKQIQLQKLRAERDEKLKDSDSEMIKAMEFGNNDAIQALKNYRQYLRDSTNSLKSLEVSGYNDIDTLDKIRSLGTLGDYNAA